jgi:hypothetical protein
MQGQQAYGHTHQGINLSISGNILETREYNGDQHCSVSAVALPGPPHYRALLPGILPGTRCYTDASIAPAMQPQISASIAPDMQPQISRPTISWELRRLSTSKRNG